MGWPPPSSTFHLPSSRLIGGVNKFNTRVSTQWGGLPRLPSSTSHLPSPGSLAGLNKFSTRGSTQWGGLPRLPSSTFHLPPPGYLGLSFGRKGKERLSKSISASLLKQKERKGFQRQLCVSFEREGKGKAFKTTCDSLRKQQGTTFEQNTVSHSKGKERLEQAELLDDGVCAHRFH